MGILKVWKDVFGNWRYFLLFVLVALGFYTLNVLITNWSNISVFYSTLGFGGAVIYLRDSFSGFLGTLPLRSVFFIIILSLFTGMLISLLVYRHNHVTLASGQKLGFFATIGVFLGVAVPGCAGCGIGLIAALGLGSSLAVLPFQGTEITILAVGVLGYSVYKVSKGFYKCEIKLPNKR